MRHLKCLNCIERRILTLLTLFYLILLHAVDFFFSTSESATFQHHLGEPVVDAGLSHKVPAGTHLIEVSAMGYFFSPVRVYVSARHRGKVQATLTETRRSLTELVLEPLREDQYYEIQMK